MDELENLRALIAAAIDAAMETAAARADLQIDCLVVGGILSAAIAQVDLSLEDQAAVEPIPLPIPMVRGVVRKSKKVAGVMA